MVWIRRFVRFHGLRPPGGLEVQSPADFLAGEFWGQRSAGRYPSGNYCGRWEGEVQCSRCIVRQPQVEPTQFWGVEGALGLDVVASGVGTAFNAIELVLILVVTLLWFVVAASVALKGDGMDRANRLAQLYGYTVCLVAVIVALTTITSLLDAAIDKAHPLQSEYNFGASLTSFESYKATYPRERAMQGRLEASVPDTSSEATVRSRYDALVADRLAATAYRTSKTFVSGGTMLFLALILFGVHWRWLRRLNGTTTAAV